MRKKLLLVEDSRHDAELTLHALEQCAIGNSVAYADDGAVGFWHLSVDPEIAVVLLDLKLQTVDGFEFLKLMRADPKFVDTPVIVVTGTGDTTDLVRAKMLGASGWVKKHLDMHEYSEALSVALAPFRHLLGDSLSS